MAAPALATSATPVPVKEQPPTVDLFALIDAQCKPMILAHYIRENAILEQRKRELQEHLARLKAQVGGDPKTALERMRAAIEQCKVANAAQKAYIDRRTTCPDPSWPFLR